MPLYQTTGTLTGTIERENVGLAQEYLTSDQMAQYLDEPLKSVVEVLTWALHADGHHYHVDAYATRELTEAELKQLSEEVSGQNSDGLGEGFEQQDFAEQDADECGNCGNCKNGYACEDDNYGGMISFDWKTNDSVFVRVA